MLFFEAKPGIREQTPTKGGTGVLPGVPLACLKLTIVMDKSPGQPGPLPIIHALGLPQEVFCPLGNPDACRPTLAHSGFPLGLLSRAGVSWLQPRSQHKVFFLDLGFTFLYQVADQLVPVLNQIF